MQQTTVGKQERENNKKRKVSERAKAPAEYNQRGTVNIRWRSDGLTILFLVWWYSVVSLRKMSRKRIQESESENFNEVLEDALKEIKPPKSKHKPFDEAAQLEEEKLSKLLFGDTTELIDNLNKAEQGTDVLIHEPHYASGIEALTENQRRAPAWVDNADESINVSSALQAQGNRKLPNGGVNEHTGQYSTLLKHKFTALVGTPSWADLNRVKEVDSDDEILRTVGHVVKASGKSLRKSTLEFKKLKDLNRETYNEGPIVTCTEFHPTSSVGLVAGLSGAASLYAVDGRRNEKLHSVAFDRYPIHCARFSTDGTEAILGGQHSHFHTYDLIAAKAKQVPLPHGVTHMKHFQVSPCGKLIAVKGRFGEVHILASRSKELIATLKQNSDCTALTFSSDSSKLLAHGKESEVTIWDMSNRKICHRFIDEGCINGSSICTSPSGQYIATGSAEGVVNLYHIKDVLSSFTPVPLKSIMNLRTAITCVKFNCTSEILGMSSADVEEAIKLVHLPSATVFSNFPGFGSKIARPLVLTFSPGSGYLGISNNRSTVALYRLKHYNNY